MSQKENELIEERFTDLIREQLTEDEFWKWVSGWYDPELIIESAEGWDIEDKFEAVITLERMIARKRKRPEQLKTKEKQDEKSKKAKKGKK